MNSVLEIVSRLQHVRELLEPVEVSMQQGDESALFLSVAPGLAEEASRLVRATLSQTVQFSWFAGRRGRVSQRLMNVLGHLQQARRTSTWNEAVTHVTAALEHLRHALADLALLAAVRH